MPIMDDRELRQAMLRGDESAFDLFFDTYFQRLYRFVSRRVDRPELAEDITQAAMVAAVRNIGTWRGQAALYTWLCTLCRHELAAHWRRAGRLPPHQPLDDEPAIRAAIESLAAAGPEQEFERRELAGLVQLTLDSLPDRYGDALEWKYIEGLSMEEIAVRLGKSVKAVESILTRARDAFRAAFSELSDAAAR